MTVSVIKMTREEVVIVLIKKVLEKVTELEYHLRNDNPRNAKRLLDDIWHLSRVNHWLPIFAWQIDCLDRFIKEECPGQGAVIAIQWMRQMGRIDIDDKQVIWDIVDTYY